MNKIQIKALILWGIVAYAVALLIYWTLTALEHGHESISALGSLLSATATFFAAYVAIKLYSDWRDPANYALKKEQIYISLGVISQLRFQIICMLEDVLEFKKTNLFLVINDDLLKPDSHDLKKLIFEIIPNIKYFNDNKLFDDFQKIQRHHQYSESFFNLCHKEYVKYHKTASSLLATGLNHELQVQPYKSYEYYGLEGIKNNFKDSLQKRLNMNIGYTVLEEKIESQQFVFDNTEDLLGKTLELIDLFENSLLEKLNINSPN
jgi:hypothetical protein